MISDNSYELNRMRSYSSIFSSTYFSRLIKHNDFGFIDSKIEYYDSDKIGNSISTYYDYIKFIYNELRKQYRNEYVYKNTFISELLIKQYGVKSTVAINEFRVGNSIADIVMFNGTSKAFEIKTELDSKQRLNTQLADYRKIFKQSYIVTHEGLMDKYLKEDESVGLIILKETSRSLKMEEIRSARINYSIDSDTIIRAIRTNEYKNIIKDYFEVLPKMNSFNMFDRCKELMLEIPPEILNELFINQLKKRKTNINIIKTFKKELRQLGLALNLDEKSYNKLLLMLNQPIKPI